MDEYSKSYKLLYLVLNYAHMSNSLSSVFISENNSSFWSRQMFSVASRVLCPQIVLVHIVRIIWLLVNCFWCMQRFNCFATLCWGCFHFTIARFSFRARKFVCCYIRLITIVFDSTAKKQPEIPEETNYWNLCQLSDFQFEHIFIFCFVWLCCWVHIETSHKLQKMLAHRVPQTTKTLLFIRKFCNRINSNSFSDWWDWLDVCLFIFDL